MSDRSKVDELLNRIEDTDLRDELRRELERHGDVAEGVEELAGSSEEQLIELLEKFLERIPEEVPPVERVYPWVSPNGTGHRPNPGQVEIVMYGPQPVTRTADPPVDYTWITTSSSSEIRIGDRIGDLPVGSGDTVYIEEGPHRTGTSFTITTTGDTREGR
jgi:hypothetical protein